MNNKLRTGDELAKVTALEGQVAGLRSILNHAGRWHASGVTLSDCRTIERALASTATVAQEHDERIRRETLERVAKILRGFSGGKAYAEEVKRLTTLMEER